MQDMSRWFKERGLLLVNLALFAASFIGMIISGPKPSRSSRLTLRRLGVRLIRS